MATPTPLLEMRGIRKSFPGVLALDNVHLTVLPGEILALLGENGAGKSTLMRCLNGVFTPDAGEILWQGQPVTIRSPHDAQRLGISMIHQELALIPYLNAGQNIYLGREPKGRLPGTLDWGALYRDARAQLERLSLDIDPHTPVRQLPIAQQQMIEVAKALSLNAKLIVMDEPTSSLTDREVDTLFEQMRRLRAEGVSIIFISHRMDEVHAVCDRATVMRDGTYVDTRPVAGLTDEEIIRMMVGREAGDLYQRSAERPAIDQHAPVLEVSHLSRAGVLDDITFNLYRGEVLSIAGLVGAGRTELAEALFGAQPATSGEIRLNGELIKVRRPSEGIRRGIALITEDRKGQGLFLRMNVGTNLTMAVLQRLTRFGLIRWPAVRKLGEQYVSDLSIRTPSLEQKVRNLSGGNQQKVVIAKWLTVKPRVLILDEPTRGIDVGAKAEIHRLMRQLADQGVGVLMISSELPEVLGVSDRVLVMREGRLTGEFDARSATQDAIMRAATGAQAS